MSASATQGKIIFIIEPSELLWSPYRIGRPLYFHAVVCSFFPRIISAAADWMSAIAYFHTCCGLSANLRCRSETCCTRLAETQDAKVFKIAIWAPSHNFVGLQVYLRN